MSSKIKKWLVPGRELNEWNLWTKKGGEYSLLKNFSDSMPAIDESTMIMLPVEHTKCAYESVFKGDDDTEILAAETAMEAHSSDSVDSSQIGVYKLRETDDKVLYIGVEIKQSLKVMPQWREALFDFSPRARSVNSDIVFWKEHGRWVYGCFAGGRCVLADVLSSGDLLCQLKGLIPKVRMKLSMLGINFNVQRSSIESFDGAQDIETYANALKCQADWLPLETISVDTEVTGLDYCPKRIVSLRQNKRKRYRFIGAAVFMLAIIGVGVFYFHRKKSQLIERARSNEELISKYSPVVEENSKHLSKMDELELLVSEHWPLNNYSEIVNAIPEGTRLIRIERIEFRPEYIHVQGRASSFAKANEFSANLRKNDYFQDYTWAKNTPVQAIDKSHWKFNFKAEIRN